jgi:hypothetical protein
MSVFGFDPGFGFTKYSYFSDGIPQCGKFISCVAWDHRGTSDMFDFDRRYWMVGEDAVLGKNAIELTNYRLLFEHAPLLLLQAMRESNVDPRSVDTVVCGLSMAHAAEADAFARHIGEFMCDGTQYTFNVQLVPQGEGASYTLEWMNNGESENYMLVDIGSNTIDTLVYANGKRRENSYEGFENRGVRRVAQLLQQHAIKSDLGNLTLPQATKALESRQIKLYGQVTDLSSVIDEIISVYTKETLEFLKERYHHEFKNLDRIVFVGGGAYFIDRHAMPHFHVPQDPEFFNAVGNLLSYEKGLSDA